MSQLLIPSIQAPATPTQKLSHISKDNDLQCNKEDQDWKLSPNNTKWFSHERREASISLSLVLILQSLNSLNKGNPNPKESLYLIWTTLATMIRIRCVTLATIVFIKLSYSTQSCLTTKAFIKVVKLDVNYLVYYRYPRGSSSLTHATIDRVGQD